MAETGDMVKMQANYIYSAKFYQEGIGAPSHNNKHPERVLLRDFKYQHFEGGLLCVKKMF